MSNMDSARILFFTILLNLSVSEVVGKWIPTSPPCNFPAIYNFGDSNSDTGAMSAAFGPVPHPYGRSFFDRPAGRESDGRLIIDFAAEHLGLPYLSSYLDSLGANFRHGANFAAEGSTIHRHNETLYESGISPFPLDIQIKQFDQFKARTRELYHRSGKFWFGRSIVPRPKEFSRALYTFDIGQNDLAVGFGKLSQAQLRAAIPNIVNQFASAIIHLYEQGARNFWIHNIGPVGCLPAASLYIRNPKPGSVDKYGCVKYHNTMAKEFNRRLKDRVITLRDMLSRASLIYVDVYSAKYRLIRNTNFFGFVDPWKICCGRHDSSINIWCGKRKTINGLEISGVSCRDPTSYVSWDGVNYSEAANHWIANHILNGSFSDPPTPIARACIKRRA